MKTYVINLPKDTERKTYMTKILQEQNIKDIVFVDAIYGKNLSLQEKEQLFDSKKFTAKYAKLPNDAQIGCTLSHRKCYEELLNSGENCCLIFEDDIVPKSSILSVTEKIEKFVTTSDEPVIILLSGWFWYTKKISIDYILLGQLYSGFLTHSYMINEKAAKVLLEQKTYYVADDWYEFRKNLGIKIYGIIFKSSHSFVNLKQNQAIKATAAIAKRVFLFSFANPLIKIGKRRAHKDNLSKYKYSFALQAPRITHGMITMASKIKKIFK